MNTFKGPPKSGPIPGGAVLAVGAEQHGYQNIYKISLHVELDRALVDAAMGTPDKADAYATPYLQAAADTVRKSNPKAIELSKLTAARSDLGAKRAAAESEAEAAGQRLKVAEQEFASGKSGSLDAVDAAAEAETAARRRADRYGKLAEELDEKVAALTGEVSQAVKVAVGARLRELEAGARSEIASLLLDMLSKDGGRYWGLLGVIGGAIAPATVNRIAPDR